MAVLLGFTSLGPALSSDLRLSGEANVETASGRTQAISLAINETRGRELTGSGYGSEESIFDDIGQIRTFTGSYAGNVGVDAYVEGGYVAVGAMILTLVLALGALYRVVRANTDGVRAEHAAFIACFVAGVINAQAESVLLRPGGVGFVVFWLSVAILLSIGFARSSSTTGAT